MYLLKNPHIPKIQILGPIMKIVNSFNNIERIKIIKEKF